MNRGLRLARSLQALPLPMGSRRGWPSLDGWEHTLDTSATASVSTSFSYAGDC